MGFIEMALDSWFVSFGLLMVGVVICIARGEDNRRLERDLWKKQSELDREQREFDRR
jgi:hypothetical protein